MWSAGSFFQLLSGVSVCQGGMLRHALGWTILRAVVPPNVGCTLLRSFGLTNELGQSAISTQFGSFAVTL